MACVVITPHMRPCAVYSGARILCGGLLGIAMSFFARACSFRPARRIASAYKSTQKGCRNNETKKANLSRNKISSAIIAIKEGIND